MRLVYHLAIVLIPLLPASVRADDKPDLQKIIDAWKAREKTTESFDFHWVSKRFSAGTNSESKMPSGIVYHKKPASTYIWQYRFVFDANGRSRVEEKGRMWVADVGDFSPFSMIYIYENNAETMSILEKGDRGYPLMQINRSPPLPPDTPVRPIMDMIFRPLTPGANSVDPSMLKLTDETESIDNAPTLILTDGSKKIWVDPAKDFVPVKCIRWNSEFTIEYKHDQSNGWLPISFKLDADGGKYTESATVSQFTVNQPIDASEFAPTFEGGAIISDASKHSLSIAYPDGKQRLLKQGEFTGKNFQDLLKSEPDSE